MLAQESQARKGRGSELTRVNLAEVFVARSPASREVVDDDRQDAKREAKQQLLVLTLVTKHFDGTNGSPEDGGREERVGAWTEETHGRFSGAHIRDVDLELKHTSADES